MGRRLERSNDILLDSIRTIAEIDQTGQEISGQLRQNRETIESVRARVSLHREATAKAEYFSLIQIILVVC